MSRGASTANRKPGAASRRQRRMVPVPGCVTCVSCTSTKRNSLKYRVAGTGKPAQPMVIMRRGKPNTGATGLRVAARRALRGAQSPVSSLAAGRPITRARQRAPQPARGGPERVGVVETRSPAGPGRALPRRTASVSSARRSPVSRSGSAPCARTIHARATIAHVGRARLRSRWAAPRDPFARLVGAQDLDLDARVRLARRERSFPRELLAHAARDLVGGDGVGHDRARRATTCSGSRAAAVDARGSRSRRETQNAGEPRPRSSIFVRGTFSRR